MVNTVSNTPETLGDLGIEKVAEIKGVAEYRLANGLKVLLVENHTAPVTTFLVLYKVGSRNEGVGFTGATHFLEHMLFKGTKQHNPERGNGIDDQLTQIGAYWNATTWFDRTSYFEVVPSEFLDLCIKLEADRMRNLLLRQSDRDSEMSVVRNELERGENYPEEALEKELYAVAFREHPYHHPTIGWRSDVEGVALERLRLFYDTFYWPNNTSVIVLGDFEAEEALKSVHKHYGKIKKSPEEIPHVYTIEPPQEGERRFEICRAGDLARVWSAFHIVEAVHPDNYPLAAIRHLLGSTYERSGRLYKALIDPGIAADVFARHDELRDPGLFIVGASLNPGVPIEKAEEAIWKELQRFATEPVTEEELARVKSANLKGTILTKADPSSLAFMLGEAESKADWKWLMEYDDKFEAVTAEDIMRVASTYFVKKNRTTGYFKPLQMYEKAEIESPAPQPDQSGVPSSVVDEGDEFDDEMLKEMIAGFEEPKVSETKARQLKETFGDDELKQFFAEPPAKVKVRFKKSGPKGKTFEERVRKEVLPNGLTVLLAENPGTQSVGMSINIKAGRFFTHKDKGSLAEMVGEILPRGSQKYSKTEIAEILEAMGIPGGMEFGVDNYRFGLSTNMVTTDFPLYLEVLEDVLLHPRFDEDELRKIKIEWTSKLIEGANNTRSVAWNGMRRVLYPVGHPFYEQTFTEQIEELNTVTKDDLRRVHSALISPKSTIISLVGDIDPDIALNEIASRFGAWEGEETGGIVIPQVTLVPGRKFFESNIPDKSSVDLILAHACDLKRTNKDFYAARLANAALGQDTITSKLGNVVRDKAGLTYGIYSVFGDTAFGGSPWGVTLTVNPKNIERALYLVDRVLDDYLSNGISEEELSRETGRAVGSFKVGLASSLGIARVLAELEFLGLGARELDGISKRYLSVTKKHADEAMRKYFHPDCLTVAMAGTLS